MYKSGREVFAKNPDIAQRIKKCVGKIVKSFDPEKIIVFGSYARGEIQEGGTMDLMIIADTKLAFFERIKKALIDCKGGTPSIEPLVYTRDEFNSLIKQGEGFLEDALEEGIVVYERS